MLTSRLLSAPAARRRYQTAGWFVPTLFFAFIGLQAGFSGIFLSKAVSQMPGNRRLRERMEFSNIAKLLFPKWRVRLARRRAARAHACARDVAPRARTAPLTPPASPLDASLRRAAGSTC